MVGIFSVSLGFAVTLIVGVGVCFYDVGPQLNTFWRSRPIDPVPPAAQRLMATRARSTVVEARGSHAIYESQPSAVAALIADAAKGVNVAAR